MTLVDDSQGLCDNTFVVTRHLTSYSNGASALYVPLTSLPACIYPCFLREVNR